MVTLYRLPVLLVTLVLTYISQDPADDATQQLTVKLPAGTNCTGGADKNLCLASFTTTAGFGNCVVISQAAYAADTAQAGLKIRQRVDVRSGEGKGVKRSASMGEEEAETSITKDKEGDKGKKDNKKKDKAPHEHRKGHKAHKPERFQRITGKRLCES
jgi:hypothetical protein